MKKLAVLFVAVAYTLHMQAQQVTIQERQATFYGLDFSKSKMVGSEGFSNPTDIVDRFFFEWNNLLLDEKSKYNVKTAFNKDVIDYDFSIVSEKNKTVKPSELVTNSSYGIDEKVVEQQVKSYNVKGKGLGIVIIVEKFDKTNDLATVWATYFDKSNKKILLTRKVIGKPSGFGLKSYWANAIGRIMENCRGYAKSWEAGSR
jgi:hypothetical protein